MEQTIQPVIDTDTPVIHMTRLTSSEISSLWRVYMNYSLLTCAMKVFLKHNQDPDIKKILEFTFDLSRRRVNTSSELLRADNRPVPIGFTDEDIDLSAPALFSDTYCLYYVKNMIKIGINVLGMALTMSTRLDVIDFFQREIMATMELWNHTAKLLLEKGLMIRPPYIETMNEVRYVQNKDEFLGSIWGGARPLLSVEIEQLYFGIITNEVGKTLLTGFRQVTPSPELRDYMDKGIALAEDIVKNLTSKLRDAGLGHPAHWDATGTVTDSTIPPFSDKLIMFHVNMMNTVGMANFSISLGSSIRRDLVTMFGRYIGQVSLYAAQGLNLAIENGWLEEPSSYVDRKELTNNLQH